MIAFRQIIEDDVPALVEIGAAVEGNDRWADELAPLGVVDQDSVLARLRNDHAGWIALVDGKPAGFAIATRSTGRLWVIAVRPDCQGQAIGRELMRQAEGWLFSHGWNEIWLTTDTTHTDNHRRRAVAFFHHLGWRDSPTGDGHRLNKGNPRSIFKLEEHAVSDPATGYDRLVRLQRGPTGQRHRLCLFLDGEHYWRDMDAVPVLNDVCRRWGIPAMTLAFVGHVSGSARHDDYTCDERYGRYIANHVVAWVKREIPSLRDQGHVIAGLSLSGLMSAYLTLRYPNHFAYCLSQSGSHWWKHEWFATMARQRAPVAARFWLSVGDQETETHVKHPPTSLFQEISQIAGVEKAVQMLRQVGGTVYYNKFHGGHAIERWREELNRALPWLLTGHSRAVEPVDAADADVAADSAR